MTTHEMILLCSSLQGVGTWVCHLCSFWRIGSPPTYGLNHAAACRSAAHFSWGPVVPAPQYRWFRDRLLTADKLCVP